MDGSMSGLATGIWCMGRWRVVGNRLCGRRPIYVLMHLTGLLLQLTELRQTYFERYKERNVLCLCLRDNIVRQKCFKSF